MAQGKQHIPTEEQREEVERMKAIGMTNEEIAYVLKLTEKTLKKHYEDQLQYGKAKIKAKISGGVIKRAIAGDNACAFFYLKTQEGWREKHEIEQTIHTPDRLVDAPPPTTRDEWLEYYKREPVQ